MFKKLVSVCLLVSWCANVAFAGQAVTLDQFKGLASNPKSDKQVDGSHLKFNNVYIKDGDLQVVKGRTRLNASAHSVTTVNMFCNYESSTGTKKLVVKEDTAVVTYDTDGTNRTSIVGSLTNEKAGCWQEGDTLYFTSTTDGLYKWTGSGSASAITGVSAPSSVDFSASSTVGGKTSGLDAVVVHTINNAGTGVFYRDGATCQENPTRVADKSEDNTACGSLSASFIKTCATSTTINYKVTKWNSQQNIESEASTADAATLTGSNTVNVAGRDCYSTFNSNTCATFTATECLDTVITVAGKQTSTTGTLASAPSSPFDGYCIYSTVANGTDYFKLGCVVGGGTTYNDGKPDVALNGPLDTTIDTIDPPKARYIAGFKGSLVLGQGNAIYFSRLPVAAITSADTYWLATDKLLLSSDNVITGLKPTGKSLLIFTNKNVYELTGFGVKSFRLNKVVDGIGAVSDETIEVDTQGDVIFFAGSQGVYKIRTFAQPQDDLTGSVIDQDRVKVNRISSPNLDDIFTGVDSLITLSPSNYPTAHAYYDADYDLYFLYIGSTSFLYQAREQAWSQIPGTQMNASVWRKSSNAAGQGVLLDNLGFFYNNWTTYANGGMSGTVTGSPTSSASTTLTDSGASFNTTSDGLKGVWVVLDNGTSLQYRQITSNTSTALTVAAWTVNPTTSDTYYIGYLVADWQTKQYTFQKPPRIMTLQALTIVNNLAAAAQNLRFALYVDKSSTATIAFTDVPNPIDLSADTINKVLTGAQGSWFEWAFRSFVYSTSTTVAPPVDIINYTWRVIPREEE